MRIHLGGSRTVLPDYVNVDKYLAIRGEVVPDDALDFMRKQGPGTVDEVLSRHMIEHLPRDRASALVGECFRSMRKRASLILECPDLDVEIAAYLKDPGFITSIYGLQRHGGDYHLWGYTKATLRDLLEKHGFRVRFLDHVTRVNRDKTPCLRIEGEKP